MFWERSCLNREVLGKSLDDSEISKSGWFRQRVKVGSCDRKSGREVLVEGVDVLGAKLSEPGGFG